MITPPPTRKAFVKSFGCQMNVYDADRMKDVLADVGYTDTTDAADADLVILNTCHIRERATEKVFSELGKFREIRDARRARGHDTKIAVAGCVAQAEGGEILRRQSAVDIVVGPQSYHRLPALLRAADNGGRVVETEFPPEDKFDHLAAPSAEITRSRGVSAFVTIQEGCDKFCSFCVVPYTRGAESSRSVAKVVLDVEQLVAAGVAEVTLLGQNVDAWHGEDETGAQRGLRHLVERLAAIPDLARIRYTTSHPNDFDEDLIAAHAEIPKLMPFVHLPVQSGSDRVLKAMNRRHTAAAYLDKIARLRAARPDIALSSDFIVGFPGETEADFEATLELIRAARFASAFSFKYSARPGTRAAEMTDQVAEEVKSERLARLQTLVEDQRQDFNRATIGREFDVLFEKIGRHPGQIAGKSPWLQPVHLEGSTDLIGKVARARVISLRPNSLAGQLV